MRDLVRARAAAVEALRTHRHEVSAFLLKHGRPYPGKSTRGARYKRWLQAQHFEHLAHQIVLHEAIDAVRVIRERVDGLDGALEEFLPAWSLAPIVVALQALRRVDLVVAVTFVAEIGDLRRFTNPRQFMGYLGLVPGERTGDTVRRGGITKAGNGRVRRLLVESAWTYRCSRSRSEGGSTPVHALRATCDSLDTLSRVVKLYPPVPTPRQTALTTGWYD